MNWDCQDNITKTMVKVSKTMGSINKTIENGKDF